MGNLHLCSLRMFSCFAFMFVLQLEIKKEELLSTLNKLKEKVGDLWKLLQISQEEQEVCQKFTGNPIYDEIKVVSVHERKCTTNQHISDIC